MKARINLHGNRYFSNSSYGARFPNLFANTGEPSIDFCIPKPPELWNPYRQIILSAAENFTSFYRSNVHLFVQFIFVDKSASPNISCGNVYSTYGLFRAEVGNWNHKLDIDRSRWKRRDSRNWAKLARKETLGKDKRVSCEKR